MLTYYRGEQSTARFPVTGDIRLATTPPSLFADIVVPPGVRRVPLYLERDRSAAVLMLSPAVIDGAVPNGRLDGRLIADFGPLAGGERQFGDFTLTIRPTGARSADGLASPASQAAVVRNGGAFAGMFQQFATPARARAAGEGVIGYVVDGDRVRLFMMGLEIGQAPAAPAIQPLSGILTAPNINIIGASFEAYVTEANWQAVATGLGFSGTVKNYAVAGTTSSAMAGQIAAAIAAGTAPAGSLFLLGHGGNDVSSGRPFRPAQGGVIEGRFAAAHAAITAAGGRGVSMPASFRYYTSEPPVAFGARPGWIVAAEGNGSRPYNDAVFLPLMLQYCPDWARADGTPYLDNYGLMLRHPDLIASDGVHPVSNFFWALHILSKMAVRAAGVDPAECWRGKRLVVAPMASNVVPAQDVNWMPLNGTAGGATATAGGRFTDGSINARIIAMGTGFQPVSGLQTAARVADAELAAAVAAHRSVFRQPSGGDDGSFSVTLGELPPGVRVTVSVAGASTSATDRTTAYTLDATGETVTVDNTTAAASNMAAFAPVVVPASGRLTIKSTPAGGSFYSILSAIKVAFPA